ncbi:hypothetical protein BGZ73_001491, partial [Actinomortierella ambigua]
TFVTSPTTQMSTVSSSVSIKDGVSGHHRIFSKGGGPQPSSLSGSRRGSHGGSGAAAVGTGGAGGSTTCSAGANAYATGAAPASSVMTAQSRNSSAASLNQPSPSAAGSGGGSGSGGNGSVSGGNGLFPNLLAKRSSPAVGGVGGHGPGSLERGSVSPGGSGGASHGYQQQQHSHHHHLKLINKIPQRKNSVPSLLPSSAATLRGFFGQHHSNGSDPCLATSSSGSVGHGSTGGGSGNVSVASTPGSTRSTSRVGAGGSGGGGGIVRSSTMGVSGSGTAGVSKQTLASTMITIAPLVLDRDENWGQGLGIGASLLGPMLLTKEEPKEFAE